MATTSVSLCPICRTPMLAATNASCSMHASLLHPSTELTQYICTACGHGHLTHAIPADVLYNSNVAIPTDHSAGDVRFAFIQSASDLTQVNGTIVEFGGGPGELAEQARQALKRPRATVMDFVDRVAYPALDFVKMDLNIDADKIPVLLEQQLHDRNLFLLSHVVEHLSDPYALLKELHRFSDSLVYIEVPDFGTAHPATTLKFSLNCLEHYHYFTDRSLLAMVQNAGFRVISFETQVAPRMPAIRVLCTPRPQPGNAVSDYNSHFDIISDRLLQKILSAPQDQEIWCWGLSAFMAEALNKLGAQRHRVKGIFDTRYPGTDYLGIPVHREAGVQPGTALQQSTLLVCGSTYSAVQAIIQLKARHTFPHAEFFTVPLD